MKTESVWDYPRPPRLEPTPRRVRVLFADHWIADSVQCLRLLETSHPPTYYIPPADVRTDLLTPGHGSSFCEFKGAAVYWSLRLDGRTKENIAWSYPDPTKEYEALRGYFAFYANRVDACYVDDQRAHPQPGGFYGGWVTSDLIGPFKGGPGTMGW